MNMCIQYNSTLTNSHKQIHTVANSQFFIDVMQSTDYTICNAVANFLWDSFKMRTKFLESFDIIFKVFNNDA